MTFIIVLFIVGILVLAVANSPLYSGVRKEFEKFQNKATVTYYFMEGCPHCEKFMPEWKKFKADPAAAGITTREFSVNKDRAEIEKAKPRVSGFPTIHVEVNGKVEEYPGNRNSKDLLAFVDEMRKKN